jgi:hypothetical protein
VNQATWGMQVHSENIASRIVTKFKNMRRVLKRWSKDISNITNLIKRCNEVLMVVDKLEEQRQLHQP